MQRCIISFPPPSFSLSLLLPVPPLQRLHRHAEIPMPPLLSCRLWNTVTAQAGKHAFINLESTKLVKCATAIKCLKQALE